jgi:hypothetical protein
MCTNSSTPNSAKPPSIHSGGKTVRCNVLGVRATTLDAGAHTNIDPDANAPGAIAASAPSTTLPIPCCTRASGRWRTGYVPPFCCASPVPLGALPGKWASMSVPAIAGAGGCAMPPCPMRWTTNWRGLWKVLSQICIGGDLCYSLSR